MTEKLNKILMPAAIIIAGILVAGTIFYFEYKNLGKEETVSFLSAQEASEKAIKYINENLLEQGITASLVNTAEENGIYKFKLKIIDQEYDSYVTKDGKLLFTQAIELEKKSDSAQQAGSTIGNFNVSADEICKENDKPLIYFFGSESCPHCLWEKPIIEDVANKFTNYISFHENIDSDKDMDVFAKYSTGGIPTLVLGCKYYRVGSGEQVGQEQETKDLTALFCKLTGEKPTEICEPVKDLIDQIQ